MLGGRDDDKPLALIRIIFRVPGKGPQFDKFSHRSSLLGPGMLVTTSAGDHFLRGTNELNVCNPTKTY